jgi:DNA-binding CsgD family transcriptional regulator
MNTELYPNRKDPKIGTKVVTGLIVGRDKKVIPQSEVEHLASLGCNDREIAEYFGITESTLRYNFSGYLTNGRHQLKTSLRRAQLQTALSGNATLLIWLGKNILLQSDTPTNTVDTKPLPWTDESLEETFDDEDIDEIKDNLKQELNDIDAAE